MSSSISLCYYVCSDRKSDNYGIQCNNQQIPAQGYCMEHIGPKIAMIVKSDQSDADKERQLKQIFPNNLSNTLPSITVLTNPSDSKQVRNINDSEYDTDMDKSTSKKSQMEKKAKNFI